MAEGQAAPGKFPRIYDDAQRHAISAEVIDRGQTIRSTVRKAGAGQLRTATGDPIPPFRIPYGTACTLVARERSRLAQVEAKARAGNVDSDAWEAELLRRVKAKVGEDLSSAERMRPGPAREAALQAVMRSMRQVRQLAGAERPEHKRKRDHERDTPPPAAEPGNAEAERLRKAARRAAQARPEHPEPPTPTTETGPVHNFPDLEPDNRGPVSVAREPVRHPSNNDERLAAHLASVARHVPTQPSQ